MRAFFGASLLELVVKELMRAFFVSCLHDVVGRQLDNSSAVCSSLALVGCPLDKEYVRILVLSCSSWCAHRHTVRASFSA